MLSLSVRLICQHPVQHSIHINNIDAKNLELWKKIYILVNIIKLYSTILDQRIVSHDTKQSFFSFFFFIGFEYHKS